MVSLIVFLGLPLPLLTWLSSIWSTLLTTACTGLLSTCSNHLSLFSTNFSTIGATPTLSNGSFLILSCLVLPLIQRNILISATYQVLNTISLFFNRSHCCIIKAVIMQLHIYQTPYNTYNHKTVGVDYTEWHLTRRNFQFYSCQSI